MCCMFGTFILLWGRTFMIISVRFYFQYLGSCSYWSPAGRGSKRKAKFMELSPPVTSAVKKLLKAYLVQHCNQQLKFPNSELHKADPRVNWRGKGALEWGGPWNRAWFWSILPVFHFPGWLNKLLNLRPQSRNNTACPFVPCSQLRVVHKRGILFFWQCPPLPTSELNSRQAIYHWVTPPSLGAFLCNLRDTVAPDMLGTRTTGVLQWWCGSQCSVHSLLGVLSAAYKWPCAHFWETSPPPYADWLW